jgi:hypothetical protein
MKLLLPIVILCLCYGCNSNPEEIKMGAYGIVRDSLTQMPAESTKVTMIIEGYSYPLDQIPTVHTDSIGHYDIWIKDKESTINAITKMTLCFQRSLISSYIKYIEIEGYKELNVDLPE